MNKPQGQNISAEENPQEAVPTSQKPVEPEKSGEENLPEETSDRTKEQFDKLKQRNKELKEKLEKSGTGQKTVLESLQPDKPNQYDFLSRRQQTAIERNLVDKDGYVDVNLLTQKLQTANRAAEAARQETRQVRQEVRDFEESSQVRDAHKKYPQLDPKSKVFDKRFFNYVRNELIGQMMKGKKDLMAAANKAAEIFNPEKENKAKEQKANIKREQVEEINATSKSKFTDYSASDHEALVQGTLHGKKGALAERLKRANVGP